jgi:hypothetical protein
MAHSGKIKELYVCVVFAGSTRTFCIYASAFIHIPLSCILRASPYLGAYVSGQPVCFTTPILSLATPE